MNNRLPWLKCKTIDRYIRDTDINLEHGSECWAIEPIPENLLWIHNHIHIAYNTRYFGISDHIRYSVHRELADLFDDYEYLKYLYFLTSFKFLDKYTWDIDALNNCMLISTSKIGGAFAGPFMLVSKSIFKESFKLNCGEDLGGDDRHD